MDRSQARRPVAVITGASSGAGRATARLFAKEGYDLVLAARGADALQAAATECESAGARAIAQPTDVSDPAQVEALAARALAEFGGFEVWINNAGVMQFGRIDQTTPEALSRVINVNVGGAMFGSRAAITHFRQQGKGVLINISSVLGVVGQPYASSYVASKFAVRGLSEALRQELHDAPGVKVCTVLPAAIDTPIYQRAANETGQAVRPIWLLYPPRAVARACLRMARNPRRETVAGRAFGLATLAGARLAPGLSEAFTGLASRLMEFPGRAADTSPGNLWRPTQTKDDGLEVSGQWRRHDARRLGKAAGLAGLAVAGGALIAARTLRAGLRRAAPLAR
ncbi:SDR family oxidoreductase [Phenylobacterium deserti]|uniref:Ketoreductase domain-containing protein n=1 Tax=Phenylobacterium deserti TaxID=1914756 RepID=A0A328A8J5_9CAUL|nr:SDR family oxidoreductase [Phenylobacterium deserti]RAK50922.1 hypothetical protein DJ018_17305 [Phenylobacterium deserti]